MQPSAGYYLVQNQIIARKWTGTHWVADECFASSLDCEGVDGDNCVLEFFKSNYPPAQWSLKLQ